RVAAKRVERGHLAPVVDDVAALADLEDELVAHACRGAVGDGRDQLVDPPQALRGIDQELPDAFRGRGDLRRFLAAHPRLTCRSMPAERAVATPPAVPIEGPPGAPPRSDLPVPHGRELPGQ